MTPEVEAWLKENYDEETHEARMQEHATRGYAELLKLLSNADRAVWALTRVLAEERKRRTGPK